jgi:hypothetical protein
MSSLAAGVLTTGRKEEESDQPSKPSGVGTYIDIFAALVPAEVLAAHAVIMTLATQTTTDTEGKEFVTITEKNALEIAFWMLLVLAPFLYVVGRVTTGKPGEKWDWNLDFLRLIVPAVAFVGWTMIQSNTAFDAVCDWNGNERAIIAIIGAVFLAGVAGLLSMQAHRETPP